MTEIMAGKTPDSQSIKSFLLLSKSRIMSVKSFKQPMPRATETAETAIIQELGVAREIAIAQIIINQIPLKKLNRTHLTDHLAVEERVNKNIDPEMTRRDLSNMLLNSKNLSRRTSVSKW